MTTYTVSMINLTRKQAADLVLSLPESVTYRVDHRADAPLTAPIVPPKPKATPEPKKKRKQKRTQITGDTILTLGKKKSRPGSNREKVLIALEKLELGYGIGTVTRNQLRDECQSQDIDHTLIYQLIREEFIL